MGQLDVKAAREVHTALGARATAIADRARATWNRDHRVEAYAIAWPLLSAKTDEGTDVRAVLCRLPDLPGWESRLRVLREMVARTDAHGLILVEERDRAVRVMFETPTGALLWRMPLRRHGDVVVCEPAILRADLECLGILWHPRSLN